MNRWMIHYYPIYYYQTMQRTMSTNENVSFGAQIAPGLYENTGDQFNPQILKSGSEDEKLREKFNWQYGKNVSVYIGWVPDELLTELGATEGPAHKFFGNFGKVNRIEFVPKFNADRKQSGHMAFVHYDSWYIDDVNKFQTNIAASHPSPYDVAWTFTNKYGKSKNYTLKCCINTNPIRKVEYNNSQLTDMFERLNTRVMDQMSQMQAIIHALQAEVATLRNKHDTDVA
jgi:hypothetical protein